MRNRKRPTVPSLLRRSFGGPAPLGKKRGFLLDQRVDLDARFSMQHALVARLLPYGAPGLPFFDVAAPAPDKPKVGL